ncbi:MAG TPA: hypothetical protein VIJ82_28890 [Streptosporangiaceae bacterium]|jgi:hypothetical protein
MSKKQKDGSETKATTGAIMESAVAIGHGASANLFRSGHSIELSEADARLDRLICLLGAEYSEIEQADEIRSDAIAVRGALASEEPNLGLIRSALKGLVNALGPVDALAGIAVQVLEIVRRLG